MCLTSIVLSKLSRWMTPLSLMSLTVLWLLINWVTKMIVCSWNVLATHMHWWVIESICYAVEKWNLVWKVYYLYPWWPPTKIVMSVTKTVSVEITRRLLLLCGSDQVSVLISFASCTFFSSPSTTVCGLCHLIFLFTSFSVYTLLSIAFKWPNLFSGFFFFFFVLGYEG